jgi:hypothetical protein
MNRVNKLKIWFGVIVSGLLLTGCATGPGFSDYRATLSAPQTGMGRIWFYRRSVMFGDAMKPSIKLDGTTVGHSIPGSFFQVETSPGTHNVSTTTEAKYDVTVSVTTNVDSYVQFYILPGIFVGRVVPTVMNEADALRALKGLKYAK